MFVFAQHVATHGFLPSRGGWMLDFVTVAMAAILPVLGVSIWLVRTRRRYAAHKQIQVILALVLLAAVIAFEVDMRVFTDWETLAAPSPYYRPDGWSPVWISLVVHLCFAVPTPILWCFVLVRAWRRFPNPAAPGAHSASHVFWARLAAWGMLLTAVTGWVFYWLAFVAS